MNNLPSDAELQLMDSDQLHQLWSQKPTHTTNQDWVRVAREIRHRCAHGQM